MIDVERVHRRADIVNLSFVFVDFVHHPSCSGTCGYIFV